MHSMISCACCTPNSTNINHNFKVQHWLITHSNQVLIPAVIWQPSDVQVGRAELFSLLQLLLLLLLVLLMLLLVVGLMVLVSGHVHVARALLFAYGRWDLLLATLQYITCMHTHHRKKKLLWNYRQYAIPNHWGTRLGIGGWTSLFIANTRCEEGRREGG